MIRTGSTWTKRAAWPTSQIPARTTSRSSTLLPAARSELFPQARRRGWRVFPPTGTACHHQPGERHSHDRRSSHFESAQHLGPCPGVTDAVHLPDSSKAFAACSGGHQVIAIGLARKGPGPAAPRQLARLSRCGQDSCIARAQTRRRGDFRLELRQRHGFGNRNLSR